MKKEKKKEDLEYSVKRKKMMKEKMKKLLKGLSSDEKKMDVMVG